MAHLSKWFYSPHQFLTLCRLLVAPAALCKDLIEIRLSHKVVCMSQPLMYIRLPTYLTGNKLPGKNEKGLGWSSFARHYSRNHYLFSLPQPTKMFQFSWFPPNSLYIQEQVTRNNSSWVSPFGHSRIKACWQLPETYRSLPRPSSVIYI